MGDDRLDRARELYEQAVFGGDADALAAAQDELDSLEADLALARGRILHANFLAHRQEDPRELALFEQAVDLYHRLGDVRGEAEACFWVGTFHQVVRGDGDAGLPALEWSYALAQQEGDLLTRSYAVRHLGFHAMAHGRLDLARGRLEESLRLRREIGFQPGVAAALLALAELSAQSGEPERARELFDDATAVARESGAHGILHWIEEARAELDAAG
jgi:tetratricopeptide (TPR) repeat protein